MRRWKVLLSLAFIPLLAAAEEKSPPAGWKEVAGGYKKQAYTVWLPVEGKLDESESSLVSPRYGQIRIFRTVCERKDGSVLAAGEILLPPGLTRATPKVRQDFLRDQFLEEVNGKLLEEKKTNLGTMAGREYLVETPSGMARFRLFGTGVRIFRVAFIGTKERVESKDAEIFFQSFKRTPAPTGG